MVTAVPHPCPKKPPDPVYEAFSKTFPAYMEISGTEEIFVEVPHGPSFFAFERKVQGLCQHGDILAVGYSSRLLFRIFTDQKKRFSSLNIVLCGNLTPFVVKPCHQVVLQFPRTLSEPPSSEVVISSLSRFGLALHLELILAKRQIVATVSESGVATKLLHSGFVTIQSGVIAKVLRPEPDKKLRDLLPSAVSRLPKVIPRPIRTKVPLLLMEIDPPMRPIEISREPLVTDAKFYADALITLASKPKARDPVTSVLGQKRKAPRSTFEPAQKRFKTELGYLTFVYQVDPSAVENSANVQLQCILDLLKSALISGPRRREYSEENDHEADERHMQSIRLREMADDNRKKARELADQQKSSSSRSQSAFKAGNGSLAKELSNEARLLSFHIENHNREAARLYFESNNMNRPAGIFDLHGLFVKEALQKFDQLVSEARKCDRKEITLIVGAGINSEDGIARLRPAVQKWCKERGHTVRTVNQGRLHVTLKLVKSDETV